MNILITAATSACAFRLARHIGNDEVVFFGDSYNIPQFPVGGKKFVQLPEATSPAFAHRLLTLCLDLDIQKVYPLRRTELTALAEAAELFAEYGINVIVPSLSSLGTMQCGNGEGVIYIQDTGTAASGLLKETEKGIFLVPKDQGDVKIIFTAD